MKSDTPVVAVSSVNRPQERRWAGPLGSLADAMQTIGTDQPVLIGIGNVSREIPEDYNYLNDAADQTIAAKRFDRSKSHVVIDALQCLGGGEAGTIQ